MSGERRDQTAITPQQLNDMKSSMTAEQTREQRATNGRRVGGLELPVVTEQEQGDSLKK